MIAANDTIAKPKLAQQTETQFGFGVGNRFLGGGAFSGGVMPWPGVETASIAGVGGIWSGWGSTLWGTYATYRTMCRWRVIPYVLSQVLGPVLGGSWLPDADEGAPKDALDWLQENIISRRGEVMPHACRSILFGNAPFETVWGVDGGRYVVSAYVPLLPDATTVMRENNGRGPFAGLKNGQATLTPAECLYILNRSDAISDEPGDDYGRSRLENIRDSSWVASVDTFRKLGDLEQRVSGVVPVVIVPTGAPANGPTNTDGSPMTYAQMAAAILPSLCDPRSQGVVLETPAIGDVDADATPAKLKQLTTSVDPLDMGNRAASQTAMLEKLKNLDEKMGEGLYRGARTLFATAGGTKADAGQHTANAEPDCEAIDGMIAAQVNEQTVRTGLLLNFGPDILKTVRGIKPAPLVDQDQQRASTVLTTMLANPTLAVALGQTIDVDKLIDVARMPLKEGVKFADVLVKAQADALQAKQAAASALNGGNPASRNVDPKVARAARGIVSKAGSGSAK
jgi:hypothetical protein